MHHCMHACVRQMHGPMPPSPLLQPSPPHPRAAAAAAAGGGAAAGAIGVSNFEVSQLEALAKSVHVTVTPAVRARSTNKLACLSAGRGGKTTGLEPSGTEWGGSSGDG
eukprot:COSAG01_NODE_4257_length_5203_cov_10.296630_9_plen_108_part_00